MRIKHFKYTHTKKLRCWEWLIILLSKISTIQATRMNKCRFRCGLAFTPSLTTDRFTASHIHTHTHTTHTYQVRGWCYAWTECTVNPQNFSATSEYSRSSNDGIAVAKHQCKLARDYIALELPTYRSKASIWAIRCNVCYLNCRFCPPYFWLTHSRFTLNGAYWCLHSVCWAIDSVWLWRILKHYRNVKTCQMFDIHTHSIRNLIISWQKCFARFGIYRKMEKWR